MYIELIRMKDYAPIIIEDIKAAQKRIFEVALKTPLVQLNYPTQSNVYLKLENLQPIRSFKIRGAYNALTLLNSKSKKKGVWTVSAGNHAQGLAWSAKKLGIKCTIVLPENVSQTKLNKIVKMGAEVRKVEFKAYSEIYRTRTFEGLDGIFVHAFSDPNIMAGTGTIGLEIIEDLPEVDTVFIPWGGGGLTCGIASAIKSINPNVKIIACEIESAAPLSASFKHGKAVTNANYSPSFVDGIGVPWVLPEMYELAKVLIDDVVVVSLDETVNAIKLLIENNCIIAEGAGSVSVAAALKINAGMEKIVCIVSGGNLDTEKLVKILQGKKP
jgi:threonine dehydratase